MLGPRGRQSVASAAKDLLLGNALNGLATTHPIISEDTSCFTLIASIKTGARSNALI